MIKKCVCSNSYQDAVYGVGNRVCNPCGPKQVGWRCTVCTKENTSEATAKKKG